MNVFATALDRIFSHADLSVAAVWISGTTSEERPVRVIRRAPDRVTDFGSARIISDTTIIDVRVSELADPRPGDLIILGSESFVIQGEPVRDSERLIWTAELVSA